MEQQLALILSIVTWITIGYIISVLILACYVLWRILKSDKPRKTAIREHCPPNPIPKFKPRPTTERTLQEKWEKEHNEIR